MLSGTFLHIPGVGPKTERRIWERGLHTWSDFLRHPAAAGLSARATERLATAISHSADRLAREDHCFFSSCLPRREHWRAYPEFAHRVAYLDIETTSLAGDDVTLIGLYDGARVRIYQKGEDLPEFVEDIQAFGLLVTYHGAGFDLPFLRRRFSGLAFDQLHIDLCPTLRRLGLKGGLKGVERQLGIARSPETEHLDGWDAVRLWREWERGSAEALELLKRYNAEDITHLETLIRYAYPRLHSLSGMPVGQELAPAPLACRSCCHSERSEAPRSLCSGRECVVADQSVSKRAMRRSLPSSHAAAIPPERLDWGDHAEHVVVSLASGARWRAGSQQPLDYGESM